jgi:hypothetical protein
LTITADRTDGAVGGSVSAAAAVVAVDTFDGAESPWSLVATTR